MYKTPNSSSYLFFLSSQQSISVCNQEGNQAIPHLTLRHVPTLSLLLGEFHARIVFRMLFKIQM